MAWCSVKKHRDNFTFTGRTRVLMPAEILSLFEFKVKEMGVACCTYGKDEEQV
jgi:hypothetical protein